MVIDVTEQYFGPSRTAVDRICLCYPEPNPNLCSSARERKRERCCAMNKRDTQTCQTKCRRISFRRSQTKLKKQNAVEKSCFLGKFLLDRFGGT